MEKEEIVFGRNPVLEYLKSLDAAEHAELFIAGNAHGKIIELIREEAARLGIRVRPLEKGSIARFNASSSIHQGVVLKLPQKRKLAGGDEADMLERVAERNGVIVALDQLTDPHNIGSIIRTTEVLGGGAVVMPKAHAPGITPSIIKASAGATAYLEILIVSNLAQFLDRAKHAGFWIVGCWQEGTVELDELADCRPAVVVVGSEGSGMRSLTLKKCDHLVRIPTRGRVSSLNASVAAGIVLYEILKEE